MLRHIRKLPVKFTLLFVPAGKDNDVVFQRVCTITNLPGSEREKKTLCHPVSEWIIALEVIYSNKITDTGMTFLKNLRGSELVVSSLKNHAACSVALLLD